MAMMRQSPWNWFCKEGCESPALSRSGGSHAPAKRDAGWTPWSLQRELDRMFDEAFRDFGMWPAESAPSGAERPLLEGAVKPKVDIAATEAQYTISVELPGMKEKDINVELSGDTLTISAKKEQEAKEEGKTFYRMERSCGSFQRVLHLPDDADNAGLKASYDQGVLTINVPRIKKPETETKKIKIQK